MNLQVYTNTKYPPKQVNQGRGRLKVKIFQGFFFCFLCFRDPAVFLWQLFYLIDWNNIVLSSENEM